MSPGIPHRGTAGHSLVSSTSPTNRNTTLPRAGVCRQRQPPSCRYVSAVTRGHVAWTEGSWRAQLSHVRTPWFLPSVAREVRLQGEPQTPGRYVVIRVSTRTPHGQDGRAWMPAPGNHCPRSGPPTSGWSEVCQYRNS